MILRSLSITLGEGGLFIKRVNIHHKTSTTISKSPRFSMHAQCARYGTPADGCAVQPPLAAHVRPHTVIEKQHVRPSQTSLQTACGCSEMRAAASGVGWCCRGLAWLLKYIIYLIFKPQSTQSAQSLVAFLCVLGAPCG